MRKGKRILCRLYLFPARQFWYRAWKIGFGKALSLWFWGTFTWMLWIHIHSTFQTIHSFAKTNFLGDVVVINNNFLFFLCPFLYSNPSLFVMLIHRCWLLPFMSPISYMKFFCLFCVRKDSRQEKNNFSRLGTWISSYDLFKHKLEPAWTYSLQPWLSISKLDLLMSAFGLNTFIIRNRTSLYVKLNGVLNLPRKTSEASLGLCSVLLLEKSIGSLKNFAASPLPPLF